MSNATYGWARLRTARYPSVVEDEDGTRVAASVRTSGARKGRIYLDVRTASGRYTCLILSPDGNLLAQGFGANRRAAYEDASENEE